MQCSEKKKNSSPSPFSSSSRADSPCLTHVMCWCCQNQIFSLTIFCPLLAFSKQCYKAVDFSPPKFSNLFALFTSIFVSIYLCTLRQLSLSQTAVFIYINYMNRVLCVQQQKWQLYCGLTTSMRHRITSISGVPLQISYSQSFVRVSVLAEPCRRNIYAWHNNVLGLS